MSPRDAARLLAVGRAVIGLGLVVAPALGTAGWVGPKLRPGGRVLTRALGARDLAIGVGLLAALGGRGSPQPWLLSGLVADATDVTATALESGSLASTALPLIVAAGGSGVALGVYALTGVES